MRKLPRILEIDSDVDVQLGSTGECHGYHLCPGVRAYMVAMGYTTGTETESMKQHSQQVIRVCHND